MERARTRAEGRAMGVPRYYPASPKCGHDDGYFTMSGQCARCVRESIDPIKNRERAKAWQKKNKERANARKNAWYHANKEKALTSYKRWKKENPKAVRAIERNHRARKRNAEGSHTAGDIAEILSAQRSRCAYCRIKLTIKTATVDHIVALSKGGRNDRRNLQVLCHGCNTSKSNFDPIFYAQKKGMLL